MRLMGWRHWGIAARLLAIAVLPTGVMFAAVTGTLYWTAQNEVHRDVEIRGRLIAKALAQSSQYGLVSGNVGYLHTTLRHLLEADPSIACIDITDPALHSIASACTPGPQTDTRLYEVPVHMESLGDVDLMAPTAGSPPTTPALKEVGRVRVTMTSAPVFRAKLQALVLANGVVLAAALLSCLLGLQLAKRLRHTMVSVMTALRRIRQGQFDVALPIDKRGELGELQRTIVTMAGNLREAREDLEWQVATRTRELESAVHLARQADADKRRLIVHSNALVEEERRRMALEIHDHLGAGLISVRLEASALVAKAESVHDAESERGARRIAKTVESLYAATRNIVKSLRPEVLDTLGLVGGVEELVRHFDQAHPACRFAFHAEGNLPNIPAELAMPAYRVVQEALTNVAKHAQATKVDVTLARLSDPDRLHILIQDDGRGFDTSDKQGHGLGLIGMRERVAAVGGEVEVSSAPQQGTRVAVTLPLA